MKSKEEIREELEIRRFNRPAEPIKLDFNEGYIYALELSLKTHNEFEIRGLLKTIKDTIKYDPLAMVYGGKHLMGAKEAFEWVLK